MRVVVDTNVLVSALLSGPVPRRIYHAFLDGSIALLFSRDTLAELIDVLSRPAFRSLTSETEVADLLAAIRRDALIVEAIERVSVCRDPKDDIFLACALAGRAEYLVTGDRDLLVLHPWRGIRILRPAEFLRQLR